MPAVRPIYETDASVAEETIIRNRLGELWNCEFVKMPHSYRLDFAGLRDKSVIAWVEIKRRYRGLRDHSTVFLSLQKVMAARALHDATQLPCLFVCQFDDCLAYVDILTLNPVVECRGRDDRDDWQDKEAVFVIPTAAFRLIRQ